MDYQIGGYSSPNVYPYSQPHMMASGGLTSIAKKVQDEGRNGDSMLVHMTPKEVGGLQALAVAHGGSLSVNPKTGLVEANFLESLLPTLIGAGLMLVPGLQGVGAGWIGAGVGAVEAMRTGDLGKGLLAGLGAFGGANLASGALAAGAAEPVIGTAGSGVGAGTVTSGSIDLAGASGLEPVVQGTTAAAGQPATFMGNLSQAGTGLQNLATGQTGAFDKFIGTAADAKTGAAATGMGGGLSAAKTAGSLVAPALMTTQAPAPIEPEKSNYAGPYVPQKRTVQYPTNRDPYDSSEFTFFNPMNPYPGFQPAATAADGGLMQLSRNDGGFDMSDGSFVMSAREVAEVGNGSSNAGLERLSKIGAKPIRGKGDGVSDSIKANIGGQQEARVARDEAYFPPEAVQKIGKGSAKKGAQKLYALMHAAEKARKKAPRGGDSGLHRLMTA